MLKGMEENIETNINVENFMISPTGPLKATSSHLQWLCIVYYVGFVHFNPTF